MFVLALLLTLRTSPVQAQVDAVFANFNQRSRVCLNDGNGAFNCSDISNDTNLTTGVALADLDGRNGLDAVFANRSRPGRVCLNDGNGAFNCSDISNDRTGEGVALADVDGQNGPDAVFAAFPNLVCLNDGNGAFTCSGFGQFSSTEVALADVDGQNGPDAVLTRPGSHNRVCLNDGNGAFTCSDVSLEADFAFDVAMADVDGQNGPDAVFANQPLETTMRNRLCLNDGSGAFNCSVINGDLNQTRGVALADLDARNGPDIVFANYSTDNDANSEVGERNRVCLNNGVGFFGCRDISNDTSRTFEVALGDVDGQNGPDAVFANGNQRNRVCLNDGNGAFACSDLSNDTNQSFAVAVGRLRVADLSITKTNNRVAVVPGESITYLMTATNAGPSRVLAATVSDAFPPQLSCTWTCRPTPGATCTPGPVAGDIADSVNLPAGATASYTASCVVDPAATGFLVNTATVSSDVFDPDAANNSASDTDALTPLADLFITKTDNQTTAVPGELLTYILTASNAGPSDDPAALVSDVFPAELSCTWTCVGSGGGGCTPGPVTGDIADSPNLPAGGTAHYTALCAVAPNATGSLANTATVSGSIDPNAANNSASDTDTLSPQADLSITKTDNQVAAVPGESLTYILTASNAGPADAPAALVSDVFPPELSCTWTCVGSGGGSCTPGPVTGDIADSPNLPVGGTASYTALCVVDPAVTGSLINTATVSGSNDPDAANNSATDTDTLTPQADLSITKSDSQATAVPGESLTYSIAARNAGPSDAPAALVSDVFPPELSCTWTCVGSGGGNCTPGPVTGGIADTVELPVDGEVTYTAACGADPGATATVTNTATVTAAGVPDPDAANNSASDTDTLTPRADLSMTKTDNRTTAVPGESLTYFITASNAGPSDDPAALVSDVFPPELSCTWSCVGSGGASCTPGPVTGDIADSPNLPVGSTAHYLALCVVDSAATGSLVNTATVSGSIDPDAANNSSTDTDALTPLTDLSITKTDNQTTAAPGGSLTYSIAVTNSGPNAVTGATVSDVFVPQLICTWTCVASGGATCTAGPVAGDIADTVNLPVGGTASYTASCLVDAAASGFLINTATVTTPAGTSDPDATNNSSTDTDALTPQADLGITKTDNQDTAVPGESLTYSIAVTNFGPIVVTGATVSDVFPPVLSCTWTCVATGGATCTAGPVTGDIADTVNLPVGATASYAASCVVDPAATGFLVNPATVSTPPGITDPSALNNVANDINLLTPQADLVIAKSDGQETAVPGEMTTYTIIASNPAGPSDAPGSSVTDGFSSVLSCTWTCAASGGATCTAGPIVGDIADTVGLPVGATATYTAVCNIDPGATTTLTNTATVSTAAGVTDPKPGTDTASDSNALTPQADLAITKDDAVNLALPGDVLAYTLVASNTGPSDALAATVEDLFPPQLTDCSWDCTPAGGALCTPGPVTGQLSDIPDLFAGSLATYTATCTVDPGSSFLRLSNTATIAAPAGVSDPDLANNTATDQDDGPLSLIFTDGFESGDLMSWSVVVP